MKKILIIENDENIFYAFNEILKKEGYIGIPSISNREEINKCWDENIQAIYFDITDPDLEEIETIKSLQNKKSSIPIVLISGQETIDRVDEFKHLGDFDLIEKPFSISAIRKSLNRVNDRKSGRSLMYSREEKYNYNIAIN
jgi:DNA-binding NtrC family response regulator